ncbi:peptidoglycan binding protein CsiV, partial [bacterium]|nr:peptidoglycan binding protein CsiV [bacterium]
MFKQSITRFFCTLFGLSLLQLSTLANATTDTTRDKQWYQIELFIFANNDESEAGNEYWKQDLELSYPDRLSHLIPTVTVIPATSESNSNENAPASSPYQPPISNEPVALQLLEQDQLTLTDAAKRISRNPDFRPLFHHAWRQQLDDRQTGTHIVITGGDLFDKHYELEGTIQLAVERYLHLSTNLWFSTFINNDNLEDNYWSTLPKRPEPPKITMPDLTLQTNDFSQFTTTTNQLSKNSFSNNINFNSTTTTPLYD